MLKFTFRPIFLYNPALNDPAGKVLLKTLVKMLDYMQMTHIFTLLYFAISYFPLSSQRTELDGVKFIHML